VTKNVSLVATLSTTCVPLIKKRWGNNFLSLVSASLQKSKSNKFFLQKCILKNQRNPTSGFPLRRGGLVLSGYPPCLINVLCLRIAQFLACDVTDAVVPGYSNLKYSYLMTATLQHSHPQLKIMESSLNPKWNSHYLQHEYYGKCKAISKRVLYML